ncbi:hypothetical protein ACLI07_22990 (plasmid) [Providencia huaxiensis]|uniref:Uncharacterized protein n=5 Tax=Enterobacterales TaxID=91347 RepID=Q8KK20_PROVU|nr:MULTISPECIES: hypothetical protein [Enterobacterales]ELB1214897.1 hypothetical protein [Proteus mirabilis]ELY4881539.1 hypothetical protein [Morganella morganii]SPY66497.1 Uncharacterised protein [Providencia stuartii]HAZ7869363.1 hypothetical protein [Escherichia coli]ELR5094338.1 hypothetical protein [Providencia rettgeri]
MTEFLRYFFQNNKFQFYCSVIIFFVVALGIRDVGIDTKTIIGIFGGAALISTSHMYTVAKSVLTFVGIPSVIILNLSGYQLGTEYKTFYYGLLIGAFIALIYFEYRLYTRNKHAGK